MNDIPAPQEPAHEEVGAAMDEVVADTRAKILNIMETYPYVSSMMIQVSLGPACPPKLWRPILEDMVKEAELCLKTESVLTAKGRALTREIYHKPTMPYPPVTLRQLGAG